MNIQNQSNNNDPNLRLNSPLGVLSSSNYDAFSPLMKDPAALSSSSNHQNMNRMMTPMQRRKITLQQTSDV